MLSLNFGFDNTIYENDLFITTNVANHHALFKVLKDSDIFRIVTSKSSFISI